MFEIFVKKGIKSENLFEMFINLSQYAFLDPTEFGETQYYHLHQKEMYISFYRF